MTIISVIVSCGDDEQVAFEGAEVLATGFTIPWAIEVLGEEEYLISERLGTLFYYDRGELTPLPNIPEVATVSDRYLTYGGLMDVSLHPNFQSNQLVYIAFVGSDYTMRVARFQFQSPNVRNFEVIFETNAFSIGSRIAWQNDTHFFVSQGSGGNPYPEPGSQDLQSDVGKIHRLTWEGEVPADNPIFEGFTQPTSIWTYGHRDPQGLYYDAEENILYQNEHGPMGGDEMNIIVKGENYGWPLFSYGLNYDGTPVSSMTEAEAGDISQLPIVQWTPSIAPSCLTKVLASNFSEYNGTFLMGALAEQSIVKYDLVSSQSERLWEGIGRVRDIAELPGGDLVILIDKGSPIGENEGRLVKLTPQ